MNLTLSSILSGLLFSSIGLWVFREGKRKGDFKILGLGLALMLYTYFTPNPWADWGVGLALCAVTYKFW
ncbi:MAG: hypothetical protein KA436_10955 [Oligoflexales bacterium]|nr:hypothetical protein [Oligoflexales bacterium]